MATPVRCSDIMHCPNKFVYITRRVVFGNFLYTVWYGRRLATIKEIEPSFKVLGKACVDMENETIKLKSGRIVFPRGEHVFYDGRWIKIFMPNNCIVSVDTKNGILLKDCSRDEDVR